MKKDERKKIYEKALNVWGKNMQLVMVLEEMSELAQAITKEIRTDNPQNKASFNLIEETADCIIMLEQLIHIFDMETNVLGIKNGKLERLKRTIEKTIREMKE